jgi:hypothetical protein
VRNDCRARATRETPIPQGRNKTVRFAPLENRPHRALDQAAPLRPLPDGITDLDHFRVRRHDRVGGVIHEYRLVA